MVIHVCKTPTSQVVLQPRSKKKRGAVVHPRPLPFPIHFFFIYGHTSQVVLQPRSKNSVVICYDYIIYTQTISYEGTKWLRHISVSHVLTKTWFKQDLQKLVCEVLSADTLFPGNVFFTYIQVQVQWWLMMFTHDVHCWAIISLSKPILKLLRLYWCLLSLDIPGSGTLSISRASSSGSFSHCPLTHCPLTQQGHNHRYSHCLAALKLKPLWRCL